MAAFDIDVGGVRFSESYWKLSADVGGDHSLGIVMLALAVLVSVTTVLAVVLGPRGDALALALSLVLLGFVLAFPVALAPEWSFFGAGAWLSVAGGGVVVVGSLLSLLLRPSATAAEAPASMPAVS
jgi:hypothetical protein